MATIIFGVVVLALVLMAMQAFASVDPRKLAPAVKLAGGIGALGARPFSPRAGSSGSRFRSALAGLGLLGWLPFGPAGFGARTQKSPGQVSRVRSAFVEMELDHDTGAMRGRILAGRPRGRRASMRSTSRRSPAASPRSTRKAARYLWRISTAGSPAGVTTCRVMRQRGRAARRGAAAK